MANIAEMVKELQQERDRLNKAIAVLASLAGATNTSSARSGASGPASDFCPQLREGKFRSRKRRGQTARAEFRERPT
jgi:hypothetical protein